MTKLSPIVSEFETEAEAAAYDAWLRPQVEASLADPRPSVSHEFVMARIAA
ncbi:MAG: type II toxin-antitoxin system RelB family antitoxin [Tsuneonella sp.]